MSRLKQGFYYCRTAPPSSSCTLEHRLNEICCASLVPLSGCEAVPGPRWTIGPLLAFGLGSVHVSSASSITWRFGTIGLTETAVLDRREVSTLWKSPKLPP